MKNIVDLSIIIVNFNTAELTTQCLLSLKQVQREEDQWEIIVVDNGSTDGSYENISSFLRSDKKLSQIAVCIKNETNVGFSAGNNIGIRVAKGSCVLLLNSDTEVYPGAIQLVYSELKQSLHAGAATCKLVLSNGAIDPACHRGFPTPWAAISYFLGLEKLFPHSRLFAQYHLGFLDMDMPHEIDAASGAFFMVKHAVLEKIGLLDEAYFMYGEDLDWAFRIREKGFTILFLPQVSVLHKKKQSGRQSQNTEVKMKTTISFFRTMQLFYKKHYIHRYPAVITWGILRLLDLRIFLTQIQG